MGLYTPTILGGNSYLSWFYDRWAIKDRAYTGTSKGLSQAINRGPIRKFLAKYANVYVTIQSHGLSAGAQTHFVTADGVRDGLEQRVTDVQSIKALTRAVHTFRTRCPLTYSSQILLCTTGKGDYNINKRALWMGGWGGGGGGVGGGSI